MGSTHREMIHKHCEQKLHIFVLSEFAYLIEDITIANMFDFVENCIKEKTKDDDFFCDTNNSIANNKKGEVVRNEVEIKIVEMNQLSNNGAEALHRWIVKY